MEPIAVKLTVGNFLKSEYVIIGFFIYKITIIDGCFDLTSIKKLQTTIKRDYEELRPGIYKLLAKIRKEKVTQLNDEKVDEIILNALVEFQKIGWVTVEGITSTLCLLFIDWSRYMVIT